MLAPYSGQKTSYIYATAVLGACPCIKAMQALTQQAPAKQALAQQALVQQAAPYPPPIITHRRETLEPTDIGACSN